MEQTQADFSPPRDEQEQAAVADIVAQAFAMSPADSLALVQRVGAAGYRVLREGGSVASTLSYLRMGQWLGGRSVPMVGVGSVGVSPAHRGSGVATRMMQALLREVRAEGVPLSVLYPATQPLYRRVGYELAGSRFEVRVRAGDLELGERSLSVRPVRPSDEAAIVECYRRVARHRQGWLDRGVNAWSRVRQPRGEVAYGYVVEGASGVEGYVYLVRRAPPPPLLRQEIFLTDLVASTPEAARRLLRFLGDHRSLVHEIAWFGGSNDPLLMLLREQTYQVKLHMHWMLRLVDVRGAMEARGWPEEVSGALHLEVEDDVFAENRGRFVLEVSGGSARVRAGGEGRMRLHVRDLASLYTGFQSAEALRQVGLVQADDGSVRTASALFASVAPSLCDMF
ncbi:GNAT family N-acetyltransferase [Myxococcaceae bacterium JPH2]|nr:GNAT family N-acetyltransferase [Myxococcaceae bacterium JPH2]